jgi:sugar lactone lactonase YvrE
MTVADVPVEDATVRILDETRCHLGEGPAYDAASGTAWWFDILEKRLHEVRLADGAVRVHTLPFMASALAFVDDARQLVAADDGLYVRTVHDGRLALAVPLEAEIPATRSNDGRAHPSGAFWIGTMGRDAKPNAGAIYAFCAGELRLLFAGITIPNAICFSPDGATGYFADTRSNVLHRVPLDPATGLPTGDVQDLHRHAGQGGLDGAVVDAEGRIWCAIWGGACLNVYSPEGELVRRVAVPAKQPSCPVFVDADFRRVLVTSAYEGMDEAARAADAHHGRTFLLDAGATGRPEPRVRLGAA